MPNRYQVAFLASFVGVLTGLVLLSNFVSSKLKAAGYDPGQLILIGISASRLVVEVFRVMLLCGCSISYNCVQVGKT